MMRTSPLHFFKFSRGRITRRLALDRAAGEVDETEGAAKHAGNVHDPIKWEHGRLERIGGEYVYVTADLTGPGNIWRFSHVRTTLQ